jgi:hypothetical protein
MLEVRPTANIDDIKAVLSHPVIWDSIASDGSPTPEEFNWHAYDKWLPIGGYIDGKPIAIMLYHQFADGDKLHIHVIPEYRKEHARKFAELALKYAQYPLYADIPDIYPNVQRFTESFGFEAIAKLDSMRTKNGQHYQITRYKRTDSWAP